jgi:hypothetical protein
MPFPDLAITTSIWISKSDVPEAPRQRRHGSRVSLFGVPSGLEAIAGVLASASALEHADGDPPSTMRPSWIATMPRS